MRIVGVCILSCWAAVCVCGQEPRLQNTLTESPLGKMAFGIDVAPDGSQYAVAGRGDTLVILDAATNREKKRVKIDPLALAVAYSPDGKSFAALSNPGILRILDAETWQTQHTIKLGFRCGFLSFHPSQPLIAVGGSGPTAEVYNYRTGTKQQSLGKADKTQGVMFSPDGKSLFVNSISAKPTQRSELRRFSLSDNQHRVFPSQHKALRRIVISGDKKYLAAVSPEGYVLVVEVDGGQQYDWHVDDQLSQFAVFLPDNRTLLTGGKKGFHLFHLDDKDRVDVIPAEGTENAYHGCFIPGTDDLVIAHTRQPNQLTRWKLTAQGHSQPKQTAGGFASAAKLDAPRPPKPIAMTKDKSASIVDPQKPASTKSPASDSPLYIASRLRTWTSSSGSELKASWIGNDANDVLLRREDTSETIVPRRKLSPRDQELLSQIDKLRRSPAPEKRSTDERTYSGVEYRKTPAIDWRTGGGNPEKGQSLRSINTVTQDSFGRTWVSVNKAGLFTYREDGNFYLEAPVVNLSQNRNRPSLVASIAVDRFDRIVASTGGEASQLGEVIRFDGSRWTRLGTPSGLLVSKLIRFGDQIIASGDFNGVAVLKDDDWQIIQQDVFDKRAITQHMSPMPSGDLIVQVRGNYPLIFDGKRFAKMEIPPFKPGVIGNGNLIKADHEGRLLLGDGRAAANSLIAYDGKSKSVSVLYDSQKTRERNCSAYGVANDGVIWVSSPQGVMRRSGGTWQKISDAHVGGFMPTADGRIWTQNGYFYEPAESRSRQDIDASDLYANFAPKRLPILDRTRSQSENQPMRTWSDLTGKHQTNAALVKFDSSSVTLRRPDGREVTMPRNRLSKKDQDHLIALDRQKKHVTPSNDTIDPSAFKFFDFAKSGFVTGSDGKKVFRGTSNHGVSVKNDRYPELAAERTQLRKVNDVLADKSGRIWIAGNSGLIEYLNGEFHFRHRGPDDVTNHPTMGKVDTVECNRLALDQDGNLLVYFARSRSYYRLAGKELVSLATPVLNGKQQLIQQTFVLGGSLHCVGSFPGIAKLTRGKWSILRGKPGQAIPQFAHPVVMDDGSVTLSAVDVDKQKIQFWKWSRGRYQLAVDAVVPGFVRKVVVRDNVIYASVGKNLLRIDGENQTIWNSANQGWKGDLRNIAVASDNSMWIDGYKTLERYDGEKWSSFAADTVTYADLYALPNGDVWLAGVGIVIVPGALTMPDLPNESTK